MGRNRDGDGEWMGGLGDDQAINRLRAGMTGKARES